jgi:SAM-dependent methyltransferase
MNTPTIHDKRSFWQRRQFKDERDFIMATGPVALVTGAQHSFRDAMLLRLKQLLGERMPLRKLVDVGCAIGDWTIAYARNGFAEEVVGVDLNAGFLEMARASAVRVGLEESRVRFVEGDASASGEVAAADLVCMGGFLQYLTATEATGLLDRIAAAQRPGDLLYIRTSCPPRGGSKPPDDYYRPRDWYDALFDRLGYRTLDMEVSAAIAVQSHAAFLGPAARALGRIAAWVHRRVVSGNKLEYVNWVLERAN